MVCFRGDSAIISFSPQNKTTFSGQRTRKLSDKTLEKTELDKILLTGRRIIDHATCKLCDWSTFITIIPELEISLIIKNLTRNSLDISNYISNYNIIQLVKRFLRSDFVISRFESQLSFVPSTIHLIIFVFNCIRNISKIIIDTTNWIRALDVSNFIDLEMSICMSCVHKYRYTSNIDIILT